MKSKVAGNLCSYVYVQYRYVCITVAGKLRYSKYDKHTYNVISIFVRTICFHSTFHYIAIAIYMLTKYISVASNFNGRARR